MLNFFGSHTKQCMLTSQAIVSCAGTRSFFAQGLGWMVGEEVPRILKKESNWYLNPGLLTHSEEQCRVILGIVQWYCAFASLSVSCFYQASMK